jgi:hypothetical protein
MTFARGDQKPCSQSGCDGTMRFSKFVPRPDLEAAAGGHSPWDPASSGETPGWVCNMDTEHFEGTAVDAPGPAKVGLAC